MLDMAISFDRLYENALAASQPASLRSPAPHEWTSPTRARFTIGDHRYIMRFLSKRITHPRHGAIHGYQAEFSLGADEDMPWMYKPTGTGSPFKVFATVAKIVREFLAKQHPSYVWFIADEPRRVTLYRKLLDQLTIPGYVAEESSQGKFTLVRTPSA